MTEAMLSVEPLLRHVEAAGGLAEITARSADRRLYDKADKILDRAEEEGYLTIDAADQFACTVLGMHPCLIWPEWFGLELKEQDTPARAVAEEKIGRFVRRNEEIVALDGNPDNLDPANLSVVPKRKSTWSGLSRETIEAVKAAKIPAKGCKIVRPGEISTADLAERYGIGVRTVRRIRAGDYDGELRDSRTTAQPKLRHLTPQQVMEIRAGGATAKEYAERFGVSIWTIRNVRRAQVNTYKDSGKRVKQEVAA